VTALSVILPVRDGEATLDQAISSIRRQTFGDFELLVIDDGSTDRSAAIVGRHGAEDARVRLATNPGKGLVAALNFGIEHASAPLLARMDADDVARPTRFERQMERMAAEADLLVLGTATVRVDANGRQLEVVTPPSDSAEVSLALERVNPIAHPTVVMRRDAVEAAGGYRRAYLRAEDYDLWLRLAERGKLANLTEPLLEYRIAGRFRRELFARQVLSEMTARAAAALRRAGRTDPTGQWDDITPAALGKIGITPEGVAREITRRSLQMARHFRKLKAREGFRDAMRLAAEQPRNGIGAHADYMLRRAKVYL
jgi:glycosyltransferase involved in cell wall biosynthesis